MRRNSSLGIAAAAALATLLSSGMGQAQSQSSIAEALYQEGRDLLTSGRIAEACPKFAESYRMEAGIGTLLNLAACNEQLGKTASAWSQFSEAYAVLSREGDAQRAQYAQEHRDALAKKLARLTVDVPDDARVSGLVVTLDGVEVGSAAWGVGVPIDPGKHELQAKAPGHDPWSGSVEISSGSERVQIPALKPAPQAQAPAPAAAPSTGAAPGRDEGSRPITVPVIIAGVATVGLAAGAGVTGALYVKKKKDFDDINGKSGSSSSDIADARDQADTMGNINLILTGGAVAGAAATLILYFTTPREPSKTAFAPWIDPHAAGATLLQRF